MWGRRRAALEIDRKCYQSRESGGNGGHRMWARVSAGAHRSSRNGGKQNGQREARPRPVPPPPPSPPPRRQLLHASAVAAARAADRKTDEGKQKGHDRMHARHTVQGQEGERRITQVVLRITPLASTPPIQHSRAQAGREAGGGAVAHSARLAHVINDAVHPRRVLGPCHGESLPGRCPLLWGGRSTRAGRRRREQSGS